MRKLIILLFLLTFGSCALAAMAIKPDHPNRYVVQPGDTLWTIAAKYLQDPTQWRQLWQNNPNISHPDELYPGDVLVFNLINGQPRLTRESGGTVKLSPKIRVTDIEKPIPTIPVNAIKPYLTEVEVVSMEQFIKAPYVVSIDQDAVLAAAGSKIYVKNLHVVPGIKDYYIYRKGDTYKDPKTHQVLGQAAEEIGHAELLQQGNPATLRVISSTREIELKDRVMPKLIDETPLRYTPQVPSHPVKGDIISVVNGSTEVGQYHIVVLDLGSKDNLVVGDVLRIYQKGSTLQDPMAEKKNLIKVPDQQAGTLMIFKTYENLSFALVLEAANAIHVGDRVANP